MDRKARYKRYVRPYTKLLLMLEYLCVPLFNLIVCAFGGSVPLAIVTGLTWLICDVLFTAFTGCSIFGIFLCRSPAELGEPLPPFARSKWNYRATWFLFIFFIFLLMLWDFAIVCLAPAQKMWPQGLMAVILYFQTLFMLVHRRINLLGGKPDPHLRYGKEEWVITGFLIVSMIALASLLINGGSLSIYILIADLVPAILVVYYAFKLLAKGRSVAVIRILG
ncbi:hypothetical protein [Methanocella sp. MCL-LM]|uniref:hypothetical protein n=1 Tax=Methanocella sp. MCL-LM TaxID=3412035 RepID=UPI003C7443A4